MVRSTETPDLTLRVTRDSGRVESIHLIFELHSRENLDGAMGQRYGPLTLQVEPREFLLELFRDLEDLSLESSSDAAVMTRRLEAKGARLFKSFVPSDLGEVLWKLRASAKTLMIVSDMPEIPWEIFRFRGRLDDPEAEGPFFAEAFALFRGLPRHGAETYLEPRLGPIYDLAFIAHRDNTFHEERRSLEDLFGSRLTIVEPRATEFLEAMRSGRFDGFHFAGHGIVGGTDPGRWALSLSVDEEVRLEELQDAIRGFHKTRPLVFLNACETGRVGLSLGGAEGWATTFLEAGASAFIGTHWRVPGRQAQFFADVFYRRWVGGMPFGEALRRARSELRDRFPGDPTRLAYVVYGNSLKAERRELSRWGSNRKMPDSQSVSPPRWAWWVVGIVVPLLVAVLLVVDNQNAPRDPPNSNGEHRSPGGDQTSSETPPDTLILAPGSRPSVDPNPEPKSQEQAALFPNACEGLEVDLILDSRTKDGEIFVDGEPALVMKRGLKATICVPAAGNYTITAQGNGRTCETSTTIFQSDNLINLCS